MKKKKLSFMKGTHLDLPDILELKSGNKGIISNGLEVQLTDTKIKNFGKRWMN